VRITRTATIAALCACPAFRAVAQRPAVITLKPADATLSAEFTQVGSIRELHDGRVLVTDSRENTLSAADFRSGTVTPIGRSGAGPGEYGRVSALYALAEDSTIFSDAQNGRWHVLHGTTIARTIPPDSPLSRYTSGTVTGADLLGHLLTMRGRVPGAPTGGVTVDSSGLVLLDLEVTRVDTIARLRSRPWAAPAGMRGGTPNPLMSEAFGVPLTGREQAVLFPDGWVAVARVNPYRVDWRTASGKWLPGAELPFTATRVDEAEKRAYVERMAKATGRPPTDPATMANWPSAVEPFESFALHAAPDGKLVIRRAPTAKERGTRYDLIDRGGRLAATVAMAENERIAGFGARAVYVVTIDADGIQRLARHPWP
jgi:hypothetical protein